MFRTMGRAKGRIGMHRAAPLLALLLFPVASGAETLPRESNLTAHLVFRIVSGGFAAVQLQGNARLDAGGYGISLAFQTVGMYALFKHERIASHVVGRWNGDNAEPVAFRSAGISRGVKRRIAIDYHRGDPVLRALVPAIDPRRLPVPPSFGPGTIDTLSAMALIDRRIGQTGSCDGSVVAYDGRRVLAITARDAGAQTLSHNGPSPYAGPTRRCALATRVLAGFLRRESPAARTRIHRSMIWFAAVLPGMAPLPVRIRFQAGLFGVANAYLISATPLAHP